MLARQELITVNLHASGYFWKRNCAELRKFDIISNGFLIFCRHSPDAPSIAGRQRLVAGRRNVTFLKYVGSRVSINVVVQSKTRDRRNTQSMMFVCG